VHSVASTGITKDGVLPLIAALPQLGSLEKFWCVAAGLRAPAVRRAARRLTRLRERRRLACPWRRRLGPNPLGDEGLNIVCNGLQLACSLQLLQYVRRASWCAPWRGRPVNRAPCLATCWRRRRGRSVDDIKATDAGVQLLISAVTTCPSLTKVR